MEDAGDVDDQLGAVRGPAPRKRGVWLHGRLVEVGGRGVRVRRLGGDRAGEIRLTRFLRNPAVTVEEMVAEAAARTATRCAGRHVLMLQDTTIASPEVSMTGLFLHAVLAVDAADGAVLGLAQADFHRRDGTSVKAISRVTPFEDRHTARWLAGVEAAGRVGAAAARVTVIGDRESDIFEVFAQRPAGVDLLIRARHDRALGDGGARMFARIDATPELGRALLDLPAIPGRRARTAALAVRALKVEPVRPGKGGCGKPWPSGLELTLVDVCEAKPPPATEPVHWRLLTTLPAADAAEAFAVADLYRRRWAIEQLFRTLKTKGFDIEGLRIGEDAPLSKLVTATLIAAVTVQQLVHAREGKAGQGPLRPLTDAFDQNDLPLLRAFTAKLQGKTARQKNPHPEASLAYAAWVCARLGGWTGYYGKPGPIVMLNGWLHFQAARQGAAVTAHHDV